MGEGILWGTQREMLLWVDIQSEQLWMHSPNENQTRSCFLPDRGGLGMERGVLIMGTVNNVTNLTNVDIFYQYVACGVILLSAVMFDQLQTRREDR